MKLIEFKEYNNSGESHTLNKKKLIVTITISVIFVIIAIFLLLYTVNKNFRNWADMHILMKTITEGSLASIDIDTSEKISMYAYDKYVALINVDSLKLYDSSAKKVVDIDISINNPTYDAKGKYMVIGDKGKQKVVVLSGMKVAWTSEIDGAISSVAVNESGYVSVVSSGSTYKSVIHVFNNSGEQMFKSYIPNNIVVDSTISSDNRYLSFAEVDISKSIVKSTVKTLAVKDAAESSENSIIYTYDLPDDSLVVNINYQGSKNVICMCDDGIKILTEGNIEQVVDFKDENAKYTFAGIDLSNTIYKIDELASGITNQKSEVILLNSGTKKVNSYTIDGIAKAATASNDTIAINLGTEIYFISSRGWLIKKYKANQEVKNVIVSDRIAAIIFRNKIEILIL